MNEDSPSAGVTLRDIAMRLGLSHSTVSRALHGNPKIPLVRQLEIQETAREMGYSPNPMATALGQRRHEKGASPISAEIAWVNCWRKPEELHQFQEFDCYWKGAHETAARHGYRLEEFSCGGQCSAIRWERILLARNIRGIIIPPHPCPEDIPPDWNQVHWERFSVVRLGYSVFSPAVHVVAGNHLTSGMLAFESIQRLGYRRIGYICGARARTRDHAGFLMKQLEVESENRLPILFLSGQQNSIAQSSLRAWMKMNRPDVIFTDIKSLREDLEEAGYRVPKDVGLAVSSVLDGCADSGIQQNSREIGSAAIETLISLMHHDAKGIPAVFRETLISSQWINGSSLPAQSVADG